MRHIFSPNEGVAHHQALEKGVTTQRYFRVNPAESRSWESPEKEDNVYRLFIQILFP